MRGSPFSRPTRLVFACGIAALFLMPIALRSGGESGTAPRPTASAYILAFNVTNTLSLARPNEVIQLNLTLPDATIADSTQFTVRRQSDMREVLSGPLNSTVELYPGGSIHRMRVAFQDSFNATERKGYIVKAGERTALVGDMAYNLMMPDLTVTDGSALDRRTYDLFIDHSLMYWTTGVRVYYSHTTYPYTVQSGILVRVSGDQLSLDQTNFQVGWGSPDSIIVDKNNVMVSAHLSYRSPYAVQWGYGSNAQLVKDTDMIWADFTVNFYNDNSMIDAYVSKKVNERFYNHNGFLMETSILLAGDGDYEYTFGTPEHTRQWANTTSLNWNLDWSKFQNVQVGNRSAPAIGDLNGDGLLDLVVGSASGGLFGFSNIGTKTKPTFAANQSLVPSGGPWGSDTSPELADLDGDGDLDLIVGLQNGSVIAFRNGGTLSAPSWTRDDSLLAGIDTVSAGVSDAAPELADLNGDGILDLLVGTANGTFLYYKNVGTPSVPSFARDDSTFSYLNHGSTLKPGYYCTPEIADVNRDGNVDFVSGTNYTSFGTLVYFQNEGSSSEPRFTKLYPAMFNNVRGPGYYTADYSVPEFADLNGDGLEDIVIGINNGTLEFWPNMGYTIPERHANTMQPLQNGSYRFYYDQDGNDGQYVTRNYSNDFYGWYVVSNPQANTSIFRYVPDFARYAYRDEYSGEMYPWAGGNTSYYPFIPSEDGRIGRGMLVTRAAHDTTLGSYGYGGTYLSQTGTAGGFLQVPMVSMDYRSHETLVMELPYDRTAALYDSIAARLMNPLKIEAPADLTLRSSDITTNPADPSRNTATWVSAQVWNIGFTDAQNVGVEFYLGDPSSGGTKLGATQVLPLIPAGGSATAKVQCIFDSGSWRIFVVVDRAGGIPELDEDNNVASRDFNVTATSRIWSDEVLVSPSTYNDEDPDLVSDASGRVWVAWHTFVTKDDFDVYARSFNGTDWGSVETVASKMKRTSAPALAASSDGQLWLVFASNIVEYDKFISTKNGIYYWSQKFDLWAANRTAGGWQAPIRISQAVEMNDSDQAPHAVFTPDGKLWTVFRNTYFDLYSHGQQMYNIPYQDMNISARSYDGASWSGQQIVDNRAGNQGWWNGATLAVSPTGTLWAFYEAELSQTQFEIYCSTNSGSGWTAPARLTNNPAQDVRPVATFDSQGHLILVWESDRNGNKDLYVKYNNGTGWTGDLPLTTDPGEDMKPSITTDGAGQVLVAWESDRTGNKDIFLKTFDGASWSPDLQATTDPHADEHVKILGSKAGGAMLAWETDRRGHGNKDIYAKTLLAPAPHLSARLSGLGLKDVTLSWSFPGRDWMNAMVVNYTVNCSDNYDPHGDLYQLVMETGPSANSAVIQRRGQGDPRNMYCQVRVKTPFGFSGPSNQQGVFKINLTGHDLVSLPLIPGDTNIIAVLETQLAISSNFTYARYYDRQDAVSPWKSYAVTGFSDFQSVSNGMGLWIGGSGPGQLTVVGEPPTTYSIVLKSGWNLVGYTSLFPRRISDAFAGLPVTRVEGCDHSAADYSLRVLSGNDVMMPGQGYWVRVSSDATWVLSG